MSTIAPEAHRAIQILQVVSLRVDENDAEARYRSRIVDFTPSRDLIIELPSHLGEDIRLQNGAAVGLEIARPDGVWLYQAHVMEEQVRAEHVVRLSWPERSDRIQRRDSARVECSLHSEITFVAMVDGRPVRRTTPGITLDLSTGGARIRLAEQLETDQDVQFKLFTPDGDAVEYDARVVRAGEFSGMATRQRFWVAVECTNISGIAARRLTRLVFELDCERRRVRAL